MLTIINSQNGLRYDRELYKIPCFVNKKLMLSLQFRNDRFGTAKFEYFKYRTT